MTTDQDLCVDGQSAVALFAVKGIDVTPSKDKGVLKVCVVFTLKYTHSLLCDTILNQ